MNRTDHPQIQVSHVKLHQLAYSTSRNTILSRSGVSDVNLVCTTDNFPQNRVIDDNLIISDVQSDCTRVKMCDNAFSRGFKRYCMVPKVKCCGIELKNNFKFKYLGSMFTADGEQDMDLRRRTGMETARCGQLRSILSSKNIPLATKLKIYKCAVDSLFTYGNEAWTLTDKCLRRLNGANVSCLSRFTGKTRPEETRESTTTYSLCNDIRRRRLTWLGHILRMKDSRLVKRAAKVQFQSKGKGDLFMDAPDLRFEELEAIAADRKQWRALVTTRFGKCKKPRKNKRALTIRWLGEDGTATTTTIATPRITAKIIVNAPVRPAKNKVKKQKVTLSANAPSFVPLLQQAKIKKRKSKPKKLTYAEKVKEHKAYLWEHHGQYRAAINAVFDSDSSSEYSGHCSFVGGDSYHSIMHEEGDTLHDFVPQHNTDNLIQPPMPRIRHSTPIQSMHLTPTPTRTDYNTTIITPTTTPSNKQATTNHPTITTATTPNLSPIHSTNATTTTPHTAATIPTPPTISPTIKVTTNITTTRTTSIPIW